MQLKNAGECQDFERNNEIISKEIKFNKIQVNEYLSRNFLCNMKA